MSTKYEPLGNTLLVEPKALSTTISLPDGVGGTGEYVIRGIGNGDKIPSSLEVEDVVIISDGMGMYPVKNTKYLLVNVESVLAKVTR